MADIAQVGSLGSVAFANLNATPAFGQATTAHNLLVAWVGGNSTTAFTVTGPSGWVQAVDRNSAANNTRASVWYKPDCGALETAPTFNGSVSVRASVGEFSGADLVTQPDQTGSNTGTTSPQTATAAAPDGGTGRLVVSCAGVRLTAGATTVISDSLTGAVDFGSNDTSAVNHHTHGFYSLSVATGSSADADTLTVTGGTLGTFTTAIASFAPVPPPPLPAPAHLQAVNRAATY